MVVHPSDQAGMHSALSELIANARRGDIKAAVDREALAAYSRRNLTRRLAQELDAITSTESLARKRGV
jgi:hypothetical protein